MKFAKYVPTLSFCDIERIVVPPVPITIDVGLVAKKLARGYWVVEVKVISDGETAKNWPSCLRKFMA